MSVVAITFLLFAASRLGADCDGDGLPDACQAGPRFHRLVPLEPGYNGVLDLVTADLDRDGDPDAAAISSLHNVLVGFNRGDGVFPSDAVEAHDSVPADTLAAGDLDRDGDVDLVLTVWSAGADRQGQLALLLNDGGGDFAARELAIPGWNAYAVAIGDLDGREGNDLVGADPHGHVHVLLNRGDAGFDAATQPAWPPPIAAALADLDLDGDLDAVAGSRSAEELTVLFNDGGGTLGDSRVVPAAPALDIAATDLDGDGHADLALADDSPQGGLTVLRGLGAGTFALGTPRARLTTANSVSHGDFTGDGRTDLVAADPLGASATVLANAGSGAFGVEASLATGGDTRNVQAADLDGDGDVDLLAGLGDGFVNAIRNCGGSFAAVKTFPLGPGPASLAAGDFDGDGDLDAMTLARHGRPAIRFHENLGRARLRRHAPMDLGEEVRAGLTAADLDADGHLDLLGLGDEAVLVLWNKGWELTAPARLVPVHEPLSLLAQDFDGDGRPELAAGVLGTGLVVFAGRRRREFAERGRILLDEAPVDLAAGDLDGDGRADLAAASRFSVRFFVGEPAGLFRERSRIQVGSNPVAILVEDLDGDGDLDAATANAIETSGELPGNVSVFINAGGASFRSPRNLAAGLLPTSLASDDFDGDGRRDLVAGNFFSGDLTFFLNLGGGAFGFGDSFPLGGWPQDLTAGDLDGDGDRDLLMTLQGDEAVLGFFERLGGPGPGGRPDACGASFRRGDFNQDGRLDLADPVSVLSYLFAGAVPAPCIAAADATDDGAVNITDGVFLLLHLFRSGEVLPAPFSSCGVDLTPDALDCSAFAACG